MTKYRCSQCGQKYSHNEYMELETASRVTDDPNDKYGVETVCECGARFHSDKWNIRETQEEAESGHQDRIEVLENGDFRFKASSYTIEFE